VGGVLGVAAGIVFVIFGVPPLLNFLFPSETVGVGETYQDDKLTLRVIEVERTEIEREPASDAAYVVRIEVEARSSWSPRFDNFVMVLHDGSEVRGQPALRNPPLDETPASLKVPQGRSMVELRFSQGEQEIAAPKSLHLEEPPIKFELPDPVVP
jgi:hypothetical protein